MINSVLAGHFDALEVFTGRVTAHAGRIGGLIQILMFELYGRQSPYLFTCTPLESYGLTSFRWSIESFSYPEI